MKKKLSLLVIFLLFLNSTYAEIVYVKYRDTPVDLSNGKFVCPTLKSSSLVDRICYDKVNSYLLVQLNGTYYHYCRLPSFVYSEWINASSLGSYYSSRVKGNYDCRLGGVAVYN